MVSHAQVANNNFAQAQQTYTNISAGGNPIITLWSDNFDDEVSGPITLNQAFEFDGNVYTTVYVSSNGFVTFNAPPTATNYTPLSSTETYAGAIAPFGADLEGYIDGSLGARDVRFVNDGNEIQVEWRGVRRKGLDEYFSFQLRLNTDFDGMRIVYGPILGPNAPAPADSDLYFPQVGLRGPNNNHANNVKNRRVTTNGNNNWGNSLPGNSNESVCRFTGGLDEPRYWLTGQTYYFNGIWNCEVGVPCDDGDPCTINDTTQDNCHCVGSYQDSDGDFVCDFFDGCPELAIGTACNDSDPCTVFDVIVDIPGPGCACVGTYQDSDGDGTCNAQDGCPNDPNKTAPGLCGCGFSDEELTWYIDVDGDGVGNVATAYLAPICFLLPGSVDVAGDCNDNDSNLTTVGATCDDGNASTTGDVVTAECTCEGLCPVLGLPVGAPCSDGFSNTYMDVVTEDCGCEGQDLGPCSNYSVFFKTDGNAAAQTTWRIRLAGASDILCQNSGPLFNNATITVPCCLPNACYEMEVFDTAGDGLVSGGYAVLNSDGRRIIDNWNAISGLPNAQGSSAAFSNATFTSYTPVIDTWFAPYSFCTPMGSDRLIHVSCDKTWWKPNDFLVANENPAVSAIWNTYAAGSQQRAQSGYEFWIYDPNGSFTFRKFRSHAVNDGAGQNALRACHMKVTNIYPVGTRMNVKVRGVTWNGTTRTAFPWGPACRFIFDPVAATCQPTKLLDIPGNAFYSCGSTRVWATNQYVHANPVSGATQYQFRFRNPGETLEVIRTSSTYFVPLGWTNATPLSPGQYYVDVRAFRNGTWCATGDPWGDVCLLNILGNPVQGGGGVNMEFEEVPVVEPTVRLWPNPNTGDQLWLGMENLPVMDQDVAVTVAFVDLSGKRVAERMITVPAGEASPSPYTLDINGELAAGMYLVSIQAVDRVWTERIVIQP